MAAKSKLSNFNDFTAQAFTQSTTQSTLDAKIFLVLQATLISTSTLSRYLSRSPSPFRRSWYICHPLSKPCILDPCVSFRYSKAQYNERSHRTSSRPPSASFNNSFALSLQRCTHYSLLLRPAVEHISPPATGSTT